MADANTWMPLYVGDYLADTARLTTEQHGCYLLLIMDYWRNGPPPDEDDVLCQIVKLDRARWRKVRPVIARLFQIENGIWKHKRIDRELSRSVDITEKRREAGKAGAAKRWDSKGMANAMANASQTHSQNDGQSQPQSQSQSQKGEDGGKEITSLLAFAGKIVRLNQRDFDRWAATYHAIPDLRAELVALDDWISGQGDAVRKAWFHKISGNLARKHQAAMTEARRRDDDAFEFGPC